jgi:hypothetical protein
MTSYNSYISDTPNRKHPWHSEAFGDIFEIQQNYNEAVRELQNALRK